MRAQGLSWRAISRKLGLARAERFGPFRAVPKLFQNPSQYEPWCRRADGWIQQTHRRCVVTFILSVTLPVHNEREAVTEDLSKYYIDANKVNHGVFVSIW